MTKNKVNRHILETTIHAGTGEGIYKIDGKEAKFVTVMNLRAKAYWEDGPTTRSLGTKFKHTRVIYVGSK